MNLWADTATRLKRWEGVALAVVAVLCIGFQLRLPGTLPGEADYRAAATVIDQEAQPGDVVLLAPWWLEHARTYLPERLPVVGYFGSEHDDLRLHRRIWVVSSPSLPKFSWSAFLDAFGPRRTEQGQERSFGPLSVRLYSNGRARPVLFSANASLASARVYLEGPGGQQPCQFNGRSWRCGNGFEVAEALHELHFEPHRCVRFFPPGGAAKLVAEFADVPAASALQLVTGYIWERGASRTDSTTSVGVEVNGDAQVTQLVPGIEKVYRTDRANTPAGTVRVWVQADQQRNRDVCFELYAFGPEAP